MKLRILTLALVALLPACGGSDQLADDDDSQISATLAGPTPFIAYVDLARVDVRHLDGVHFTVAARSGTVSKPVAVRYSLAHLRRAGYLDEQGETLRMPVFGLYAGHVNGITIELEFTDGSRRSLTTQLQTGAHTGANAVYSSPVVMTRRTAGDGMDINYFYIHSGLGTPVVIDSDGHVRWSGVRSGSSTSSLWTDNGFVVGAAGSTIYRYELDGRSSTSFLTEPRYYQFHHNIEPGKTGLLGEFDLDIGGVHHDEFTLAEFDPISGRVLKEWDFAQIIGDHMTAQGDDPSNFVVRTRDWFHMNSAIYDARDGSILASSRENFVVKIDYATGRLIWILGDPTKYWYTFPSLRAKSITLPAGHYYPIGQHALSITPDGYLQLFNNGFRSVNQPADVSAGENRDVSVVSTYAIDAITMTGREVRRHTHPSALYSDICSSAYTASDGSLLVSYAATEGRTQARVTGINPSGQLAFDYQYASAVPCQASYNAEIIRFESLRFD